MDLSLLQGKNGLSLKSRMINLKQIVIAPNSDCRRVGLDMKICETRIIEGHAVRPLPRHPIGPAVGPARLRLVSDHEMQDLGHTLARGQIPADLEAKLLKLAQGDLAQHSIEQNCRLIIVLLQAVYDGAFKQATPEDCDRLLRVLAYVRKDDDAIPDYRPDGFADDQEETRAASRDFHSLLQNFKEWRLRHKVPAMWAANGL